MRAVARREARPPQPVAVQPDTSLAQPQTAALPWMTKAVARQWNADRIKQAQTGLRNATLYGGRISGVFDAQTRNAVREYQRLHNLAVTGHAERLADDHVAGGARRTMPVGAMTGWRCHKEGEAPLARYGRAGERRTI